MARDRDPNRLVDYLDASTTDDECSLLWFATFDRPMRPDLHARYHDLMTEVGRSLGPTESRAISTAAALVLGRRYVFPNEELAASFALGPRTLPNLVADAARDVLEPENRIPFRMFFFTDLWDALVLTRSAAIRAIRDASTACGFDQRCLADAWHWFEEQVRPDDQVLFRVAPRTQGLLEYEQLLPGHGFLDYDTISSVLGIDRNAAEKRASRVRQRFVARIVPPADEGEEAE